MVAFHRLDDKGREDYFTIMTPRIIIVHGWDGPHSTTLKNY